MLAAMGLTLKPASVLVASTLSDVEIRHRLSHFGATQGPFSYAGIMHMPEVTIVYWRDIPAQIIVGKGRSGAKVKLTERFEQAIDRVAMKVGARDADAYLAEWRKAAPFTVEGEQTEVAQAEAARIEATYDSDRLKSLINSDGWAKAL
jgi:hypothetical protein